MTKEYQELDTYSKYLTVKAQALHDQRASLSKQLKEIERELEIIEQEAMDVIRKAQFLLSKHIEEELTCGNEQA